MGTLYYGDNLDAFHIHLDFVDAGTMAHSFLQHGRSAIFSGNYKSVQSQMTLGHFFWKAGVKLRISGGSE